MPDDEFGRNDFTPRSAQRDGIGQRPKEKRRRPCAEHVDGDAHGGETGSDVARDGNVVEADDADIAGYVDVGLAQREQRADGHGVIGREQRGGP